MSDMSKHGELYERNALLLEVEHIKQERDKLLEALEIMIIGACACGIPHQGERKVLQEAVDHARAIIAEIESQQ